MKPSMIDQYRYWILTVARLSVAHESTTMAK